MKAKKLLALLLAVVFVATQFAMLGSVSASTAFTGRSDFAMGVNLHSYAVSSVYRDTAKVMSDASSLGSNIVRTNIVSSDMKYNISVADLAAKKGMQVMAIAGFDYYDAETKEPIAAADINVAEITSYFTNLATQLNGKVSYYQINNEMDGKMIKSESFGELSSNYKDVNGIAKGLNAAYEAIKDVDPNAKVVVNFCYDHYGFIKALKDAGAKWDITGFDWYYTKDKKADYYDTLINAVVNAVNKPVIVCEANVKPTGYDSNGNVEYNNNAAWLGQFAIDCYNNDNVVGFIAYELYDSAQFETDSFNAEAHFGLIDKNGNKKDTFNTLAALYGGSVDNAWHSPEMPVTEGQFNFIEGGAFTGIYGSELIDDHGHFPGGEADIKYTNPGFADYSYFEFDYYVDNIDNLKARNTKLYFNLRKLNDGKPSKVLYNYTEQLTQTGWNHVKISIKDLVLDANTLNSIDWLRFYIDIDAGDTGADDVYIISNICATIDSDTDKFFVPEMIESDGMFVIHDGVNSQGTFGSEAITGKGHLPGGAVELQFTNPGFAAYSNFVFDFYVADINNLNARNTRLYISLRKLNAGEKCSYEFTDYLTQTGWNHVEIPMDAFGLGTSTLNSIDWIRFYIDIDAGATGADDLYALANICATTDFPIPEMIDSEGMFVMSKGLTFDSTLGDKELKQDHLPGYNPAEVVFTNPGLADYSDFEFDFYVANIDNFKARNVKMEANLRLQSSSKKTIDFTEQITKTGWNHIKISTKSIDADTLNTIVKFRFYITINAGEVGGDDRFVIANLCATTELPVPALTTSDGMFIIKEGIVIKGELGYAAVEEGHPNGYNGTTPAEVMFEYPVLAAYDYIEFDYFVANLDNFNAREIKVAANVRTMDNSKGTFYFTEQITKNGWNHIKIAINSLDADTLNSIIKFRFYITINDVNAGANDLYALANISATTDFPIPEMVEAPAGIFIIKDGIAIDSTLGSDAGSGGAHPNGFSGGKPAEAMFTNPVLADYGYFEFDYYVANIENFNARVTSLQFNLRTNDKSQKTYEFKDQITQSGWNHVKISINDVDADTLNSIIKVRLYMDRVADEIDSADDRFVIANICATKVDAYEVIPQLPDELDMFVFDENATLQGTLGSKAITGQNHPNGYSSTKPAEVYFTNPGLATYDYFEFDFYLDDVSKIAEREIKLYFNIRYIGASKGIIEFQDQITQNGWNHVKLDVSALSTDVETLNQIERIRLYMDITAGGEGARDRYRLANVCAVRDLANVIPELNNDYRTLDSIAGVQHAIELAPGENASASANSAFQLEKELDTAFAEYIEMDIYVSADVNAGAVLWVSGDGANADTRGAFALPNDLKLGWNHVVIDASKPIETVGDFTFKDCLFAVPYLDGEFFTADHPTGGLVKIANLSVTRDIVVPTDVMSDNISFLTKDIEFASFDVDGMLTFEFGTAKDLTNAKMIELDIFVEKADMNTVIAEIMDINGNYAEYEFSGLTAGWNHLAVRIADLTTGADSEGDVDLANIGWFTLWGNADANIIVANAYAADYVEGDANRDGKLDLKDVVRAKKMYAELTTAGNKLAFTGNDYTIDSADLVALSEIVISALFK